MNEQEPIHLYLSRYREHLQYLRDTGQETPGWRELRDEDLPGFLQITDSTIEIKESDVVRDLAREGSWKPGSSISMQMQLKDGTVYIMHGYFVEDKKDWYPNENPVVHKSNNCGFCQSIIGLGKDGNVKEEFCMLPLPEKKYLFEEMLNRHREDLYHS
ncbi:hypothetical protein [Alteribacillus sp. HJP-4]|uniref:hypothetical protein n=1 Tax=Alteribacillus sp. HJP-4 TaxID=2775394 RepID=UPI0035CCF432